MLNGFVSILIFVSLLFVKPLYADYDYGDPTDNEQAHLEAINRARANPLAEAARLGFDLFEGVATGKISSQPSPPLVSNAILLDIARAHSLDMLDQDYFAHDSLSGETASERAENAGYNYRRFGENIAFSGTTGSLDMTSTSLYLHDLLFIDEDYPGRGHRINILIPDFKEVGVGLQSGIYTSDATDYQAAMITTDFGSDWFDDRAFVTGVVYDDQNQDGLYTAGEGLSGVKVSILETGEQTISASAGGYAIPVDPGSYTIRMEHTDLGGLERSVNIEAQNIKLDILSTDFDKTDPLTPIAYAQYDGGTGQVSLPAVKVFTASDTFELYSATLQLVSTSPHLRFQVVDLTPITDSIGPSVSEYSFRDLLLTIPLIEVSDGNQVTRFSANLQLSAIENGVIFFDLVSATLLEADG